MSIIKIPEERKEQFSLVLHPEIDYLSSSIEIDRFNIKIGVTGSAPLRRRPSSYLKVLAPQSDPQLGISGGGQTDESSFNESNKQKSINLLIAKKEAEAAAYEGRSANITYLLNEYMNEVNLSPEIAANKKKIYITRFDPPFSFTGISIEKSVIQNNLMTFYEPMYDLCEMSYTNYHSLNFFSAPEGASHPAAGSVRRLPDASAIVYQNFSTIAGRPRPYSPSGSFSFDFYLNPRYPNDPGKAFNAGTIMHLSSTFALSLISGSAKDGNDLVSGYRLMLQLSHSADIPPSQVDINNIGTFPKDLIFLSGDNTLSKNVWNHCTVRWGTKNYNDGTGSFVVENKSNSFVIPSSSIMPPKHISNSALVIGNYYEGKDSEAKFFNKSTISEGVSPTLDFGAGFNIDPVHTMRHPLNAEVHELKIYKKHLSNEEISKVGKKSPISFKDMLFYVPPFFTPLVPDRNMLITPFQNHITASRQPFNEIYSFGIGGFIMNLENHVVDFVTKNKPRCFLLTASINPTTVENISANDHVFQTGSMKKRNLTILPNDNGKFIPDYRVLERHFKTSQPGVSFPKRRNGGVDLSIIPLKNMISKNTIFTGLPTTTAKIMREVLAGRLRDSDDLSSDSIAGLVAGVTPESTDGYEGPILTIAQRTRDRTSNEICFFDISNLYYGNRVQGKSLYITDPVMTGSDDKIKITISDNGAGGLYRSDADGPHPKWSNIGNILYEDGIAIVKSPSLSYFGQDCFELKMKGEQNTHISILNIPLDAGMFNSSSNPNYLIVSASSAASDEGKRFVYIDSLNIHDENLNVIARSNFAQPIKKRVEDSMLIRFKMDF